MRPILTMQSMAYCTDCYTFHEPDDLTQSWRAVDEPMCPNCGETIGEQYQP